MDIFQSFEVFSVFKDWLTGNMGIGGDYIYTAIHWWTLAAVLAICGLVFGIAFAKRQNTAIGRRILVVVAVFQLSFEILWRLIYVFVAGDSVRNWWPMYPCNLGGILLPIFALTNCKKGKQMFYLFGFVGGVLTFAMPDGIFSNNIFVFPILKSVLQHTGLLLIPVLEYISGEYRPTLKDIGWVILGCLVHIVNCEGIDRLLGFTGDYMFFHSGLPFVIPGVPQFITISVFALMVFILLCFLSDIKGSVKFLKSMRKSSR
jgi:uncharacterized membrane protein YwaF